VEMMSVHISWIECLYNCDLLKKKLIELLATLEEELMVAEKFVQYQANKLKN
jgi:hypothetical protein